MADIQPFLAVLHPQGGVGRSTTVWQLGAELALRGKRVRIEDLDQELIARGLSISTRLA